MPELLKNVYTKNLIEDLGKRLNQQDKKLQPKKFSAQVFSGDWKDLELKARMSKISDAIHAHLTGDFNSCVEAVCAVAESYRSTGNTGFEYMFLPEYVEKHGLSELKTSLKALGRITETGSSEFAIRPFLVEHESKTLKQMQQWTKSKDEHLRRLASEGCRPRLPWAMALPAFKKDPGPILPILEQLKTDESLYVRRSVANNLNDISKDHPELALDIATDWQGISDDTDWLIKHACRGLLKAGHPRAMTLFGFAPPDAMKLNGLKLNTADVKFGGALEFSAKITSKEALGTLRLEYAIDFVRANGSLSRKVFKISETDYESSTHQFSKVHKFVPITTRVHYPGKHYLALIVNGVEMGKKPFQLTMEKPG